MSKKYGYLVRGKKVKQGKFCKTLGEAGRELVRQLRAGVENVKVSPIKNKKMADQYSKKIIRKRKGK